MMNKYEKVMWQTRRYDIDKLRNAIQKFRNLDMLRELYELRSSTAYALLCSVWASTDPDRAQRFHIEPEDKVTVTRSALVEVICALNGPGHYARELQVIANLPSLPGITPSPINILKEELTQHDKENESCDSI